MRIIQAFILLCMTLPWTGAMDIVCGNNISETVLIRGGDSFSFKTQAGSTYQPDTNCVVKYKLRSSCLQFRFSCSLFDIENKDQNCEKLDRMTITADGQSKSYCQRKGPNMITTGPGVVKVSFLSGKTRQAAGAECSAQCVVAAGQTVASTAAGTSSRQKRTTTTTTERTTTRTRTTTATYGSTTGTSYDYIYPTYTSYDYYPDTTYYYSSYRTTDYPSTDGEDSSSISAVSDLLHLLPLLRIPIRERVEVPGSRDSATISSDNILHDLTISYKGGRYNVLMEDVASIINIPQTLRNVKVFHHDGTKHFRIVRHRDNKGHKGHGGLEGHGGQGGRNEGTMVPVKKGKKKGLMKGQKKPNTFLVKKKKMIKKKQPRKNNSK